MRRPTPTADPTGPAADPAPAMELPPIPGRPLVFALRICTRCGRIDHDVENCPLPAPGRGR